MPVESEKYLLFRLGRGRYGLPIQDVREIIRRPELVEIPGAPASVQGIFNLRGEIHAVINLRSRFGLSDADASGESDAEEFILLLDVADENMAAIVDSCYSVEEIASDEIADVPEDLVVDGGIRSAVRGIVRRDDHVLLLVEARELLPPEQLARLKELKEASVV